MIQYQFVLITTNYVFIHFQFVSRVARGEDVTRPRDSYKTWTPLTVDDLNAKYGVCLVLEMVSKDRLVRIWSMDGQHSWLLALPSISQVFTSDRYYSTTVMNQLSLLVLTHTLTSSTQCGSSHIFAASN